MMNPQMKNVLMDAALTYVRRGWMVLPLHGIGGPHHDRCTCNKGASCTSPGKHPRTKNGLKNASSNVTQVRSWWTRWPNTNIGIRTGTLDSDGSGFWVLDVDGPEGEETLQNLTKLYGDLPATPTEKTGHGWHILFAFPPGKNDLKNKTRFAPGLDVRANNGYIVIAPSRHISGNQYAWVENRGPDIPLAQPPEWLTELIAKNGKTATRSSKATDRQKTDALKVLDGVPEGQRDDTIFRYACRLRHKGLERPEIESLVLAAADHCVPPFPHQEAMAKVESAMRYPGPDNVVEGEGKADKPELIVSKGKGEEQNIARAAIRILKDNGANIFLHGDQLVKVVRYEEEIDERNKKNRQNKDTSILQPVTTKWLSIVLQDTANIIRFDAGQRKFVKTSISYKILDLISGVPELGKWPKLKSIVKTPLLLPDGTWISAPSFHRTPWGGFYLDIDTPGGDWQEPGQTKEEAEDALAEILEHFRYMAWGDDLSRSVALSALLTAIMRPVMDTAPMHVMDAPVPGTGKSLFASAVSIITSGGRAASISYSRKDEENEKRLDALLMAGDSTIIIDNVSAPLQGDMLNQILTEQTRKTRVLGESKIVSLPCTPFIMATGNNIVIRGDLVRRCVVCRLDAHKEDPENRDIPQNLLAETHQKRKQLVYWLQTIMRAYITACQQEPDECQTDVHHLGSFESWTPIRQALVWLGQYDPVETIRKNKDNDPDRNNMLTLYTEWHTATPEPVKVSKLIQLSESKQDLRDAIHAVASTKGVISSRKLGYWLRAHRDIPLNGLMLVRTGRSGHYKWAVVKQQNPSNN